MPVQVSDEDKQISQQALQILVSASNDDECLRSIINQPNVVVSD